MIVSYFLSLLFPNWKRAHNIKGKQLGLRKNGVPILVGEILFPSQFAAQLDDSSTY
jgi:hypothetical protein